MGPSERATGTDRPLAGEWTRAAELPPDDRAGPGLCREQVLGPRPAHPHPNSLGHDHWHWRNLSETRLSLSHPDSAASGGSSSGVIGSVVEVADSAAERTSTTTKASPPPARVPARVGKSAESVEPVMAIVPA